MCLSCVLHHPEWFVQRLLMLLWCVKPTSACLRELLMYVWGPAMLLTSYGSFLQLVFLLLDRLLETQILAFVFSQITSNASPLLLGIKGLSDNCGMM